MTAPSEPRSPRRWAVPALITVLAAVIVVVVVLGVVAAATAPRPGSSTLAPEPTGSVSATTEPSSTASPSSTPTKRTTPVPAPAATPQPTRTATISKPSVIVKALTAKVTKIEAVSGKADGPGEVGGPSVRFTITISNTTGKTVDLSNTVVNAYYGRSATPAIELRMPGGRAFPASVATGRSASGVFVFNIPVASRSVVEVTVDTSVKNPVIAFRGPAPK